MIELLSPVGDFECLKVAVQNGADAVYFGANLFSARAFASNFDDNILVLNTSQRKPIIAPSQLTNTKNAYLEQLNHHQHLLELLTIQYQIEKLNIKLHKFKVEDYENIIKEKCSLEKDFFEKRLKYNIE